MEYAGVFTGDEALSIGPTFRIGKREFQHRNEGHIEKQTRRQIAAQSHFQQA
jgi:hypothetical protein